MGQIIQINYLTKSYGANPVLNNTSIDIEPGQVIGYIGPNGAGKSTTIKILAGLLPYFSGDAVIIFITVYHGHIVSVNDLMDPEFLPTLLIAIYSLTVKLI